MSKNNWSEINERLNGTDFEMEILNMLNVKLGDIIGFNTYNSPYLIISQIHSS